MGIALGQEGYIIVADEWNSMIRKISPDGVVSTVAGQAKLKGDVNGPGPSALFRWPTGVAVDGNGFIYVSDKRNSTIRVIAPSGVVSTLAGYPGIAGSADGLADSARFSDPQGIAVDGASNLFVADCTNNTIRKITSVGMVTTIGGLAESPGSTDGPGADARFNRPNDVALDTQGNLYVSDGANGIIRKGHRLQTQP
jgi:sugar lactone lactonase YvrE